MARNLYTATSLSTGLGDVAVSTEATTVTTEPTRIRSAQVQGVSGGTVTVQVYADGRPLFDDTQRPVSGGAPMEATDLYTVPAGTVVTTVIEADSGTPTGTPSVLIEAEAYTLVPRSDRVELRGKDRLRPSRRRRAAMVNEGLTPSAEVAAIASGGRSEIERRQVEDRATPPLPGREAPDRRDRDPRPGGGGGPGIR
jgi:hypothetical protein